MPGEKPLDGEVREVELEEILFEAFEPRISSSTEGLYCSKALLAVNTEVEVQQRISYHFLN